MKIGNLTIEKTACFAPMAGVADRATRELMKEYGAAYLVGEMASSKGLTYQGKKTEELLLVSDIERPMAVQIFGGEPHIMAQAAKLSMRFLPDVIDLNMGCPAPKVAKNGGGSILMKTPGLAGEIVKAVKAAVSVPVTVKFRKGWDDQWVNAVEFAKRMEDCGADAICIHGRTRQQMYAPPVDLDIIAAVKQAVEIPVIGNGDVDSLESCLHMYQHTGCDLVMIGRGALGSPWLFEQIKAYMESGTRLPEPTLEERMAVMQRHVEKICRYKGERNGMREARKHAAWYFKGFHGAAAFRRQAGELTHYADIVRLAQDILEKCSD